MKPVRIGARSRSIPATLHLIREAFAYMDGLIDPPSSIHRMTEEDLRRIATTDELWIIGAPPVATVTLIRLADTLYLGKMAVAESARGQGLGRMLVNLAEERAQAYGMRWLKLQSRVELTENHAAFRKLGFELTDSFTHEGYDHPTSLTFTKGI